MQKLNKNAAQPGLNQNAIKSLKLLMPNEKLIVKFDEIITPMMKVLFDLANQGETQSGFVDFATALESSLKRVETAYQKDGKISVVIAGTLINFFVKIQSDLIARSGNALNDIFSISLNYHSVAVNFRQSHSITPQVLSL